MTAFKLPLPINQRIHLASRPTGAASLDNFQLQQEPLAPLREGQLLVRHHYLSIDPCMRGRMSDARSYVQPHPLGAVMPGRIIGQVLTSRNPAFEAGRYVTGQGGWQLYSVWDAEHAPGLREIEADAVPLSAHLGPLGMPAVAAWYGMNRVAPPQPGETVVVSAASGAVGSVAGQLARLRGCHVVGIAGGAAKCAFVRDELGFDACVDYKTCRDDVALYHALAAATPHGVDVCFENVGGAIFDATLARMNPHGRIAVCGTVSGYDTNPRPMTDPSVFVNMRLRMQGFTVSEHEDIWPEALRELGELLRRGQLRYRESIAQGLQSAPAALLEVLRGGNFGKQLVCLC